MDAVLRGLAIYAFLLVLLRIAGKRTLAEITNFDLVLLIVIAEGTQQGMIGDDFSVTQAVLIIVTLVMIDVGLSLLKGRFPRLDKLAEGVPLVIAEDGVPKRELMRRARVDAGDVMEAARQLQGLERMDQIKYAVLERTGGISIIPRAGG
jgi:uncharacterized membrane protein YcaP (DUF421 family)